MSLKGIKALVARLHSDEETMSSFASDPDAVISEYSLTAAERKAIREAHLQIGPDGTLTLQQSVPTAWWYS